MDLHGGGVSGSRDIAIPSCAVRPVGAQRLHRTHLVIGVLLAVATPAAAQVFSPGPLSKAHADLEGIGNCTRCHAEGGKHDNAKCLSCHEEIGSRQARNEGYHRTVKARQCAECHREHKGAGAEIIEWLPSKRAFNHGLTGWPLEGSHKKQDCKKCHEPRRIVDDDVLALVKKTNRATLLGVSQRCVRCHFDEHRGQEGDSCQSCHNSEDFKHAPGFNHNDRADAHFALTGKHRAVDCEKCHQPLTDENTADSVFPAPRDKSYLQFKDVPHGSCVECHEDPHRGQFGKGCARCHTTEGWKTIKAGAEDTGFHDKTDFPLRGEHTSVACKTCHGPFKGQRAVFKGLKHKRCADCHTDAHLGQVAAADGAVQCEKCHDVSGFIPVLFNGKLHDETRFALDGSHEAVACNLCHKADARLPRKVTLAVRKDMERKKRRVLVSDAVLNFDDVVASSGAGAARCESCHADPHGGQFAERVKAKGCNSCHVTASFAQSTFSHDESRFPLTGKHKDVSCNGCHAPSPTAKGKQKDIVVYRPLEIACASCHADRHLGQLAQSGVTDCARCHETKGFKPARFNHDTQSLFPLVGKHKEARCETCHPSVDIEGTKTAKYKPLPVSCAACHDDEHKGRFDPFIPGGAR